MDTAGNDMAGMLITLTSDIAAAHVSNNRIPVDEVSTLIENIYGALAGLGKPGRAEETPLEPMVSIRSSVRPDYVACLECGKKKKMLKRHLAVEHGMTAEKYRERWNLRIDHPIVAPNYSEKRSEIRRNSALAAVSDRRATTARKSS